MQGLDAFVEPLVSEYSGGRYDISAYIDERKKAIELWEKATTIEQTTKAATELFRATVRVLSRQRLFKVRHYSFVVIGKKRTSSFPTMEELQTQELEDDDST